MRISVIKGLFYLRNPDKTRETRKIFDVARVTFCEIYLNLFVVMVYRDKFLLILKLENGEKRNIFVGKFKRMIVGYQNKSIEIYKTLIYGGSKMDARINSLVSYKHSIRSTFIHGLDWFAVTYYFTVWCGKLIVHIKVDVYSGIMLVSL